MDNAHKALSALRQKTDWQIAAASLAAAIYFLYVMSPFLFGQRHHMGPGDGLLIASIHENFFQAITRLENPFYLPIFYPYEHANGGTDSFLFPSILYSVFRFTGAGVSQSYELTYFLIPLIGYALFVYAGWKYLKDWPLWWIILLGAVCVYNINHLGVSGHVQLMLAPICIPLLFLAVFAYDRGDLRTLAIASFVLGLVFCSTVYVGYFTFLIIGFYIAWHILLKSKDWAGIGKKLGAMAAGLAIPGVIFLYLYLPASLNSTGGNPDGYKHFTINLLDLFVTKSATLSEYFIVGDEDRVTIFPELAYGIPFLLIILGIYLAGRLRETDFPAEIAGGSFAVSKLLLWASASAIIVTVFHFGHTPIWAYFAEYVPIASAMRAYSRSPIITLPALILAIGLIIGVSLKTKQKAAPAYAALFLVSTVSLSTKSGANQYYYYGSEVSDYLSAIPNPPEQCSYMSFMDQENGHPHLVDGGHSMAMMIAAYKRIPTLDGRMPGRPQGWVLLDYTHPHKSGGMYEARAWDWIQKNNLDTSGYCWLTREGEWFIAEDRSTLEYKQRGAILSPEQVGKILLNVESAKRIDANTAELTLKITNQNDFDLHWRHKDGNDIRIGVSTDNGQTYPLRIPLIGSITANSAETLTAEVKTDADLLLLSLVQELQFWAHAKGIEPASVRVLP